VELDAGCAQCGEESRRFVRTVVELPLSMDAPTERGPDHDVVVTDSITVYLLRSSAGRRRSGDCSRLRAVLLLLVFPDE
jgi:hypothetical protein